MNICKDNELLNVNELFNCKELDKKAYIHLEHVVQLTNVKEFCENVRYLCLLLQNNLEDILITLEKKHFNSFFDIDFSDLNLIIDSLNNRINSEIAVENYIENLKLQANEKDSFKYRFNYGFYYQCLVLPLRASCLLDKVLLFFDIYYNNLARNYDGFVYNAPSLSVIQTLRHENSSALGAIIVELYVNAIKL